jgi:hypothetical protein
MNPIGSFLDQHDAAAEARQHQESRDGIHETDAQRLLRFDAWVKGELEKRLDWAWAGEQKVKRVEQCRVQLEGLVLDLWRRGWMLDGKKLAGVITAALDDVAKAQKAGRVQDFWAFFVAITRRHVGVNSEEIQLQARSAGALLSQALNAIVVANPAPAETPLPQLIAQRREEIVKAKSIREQQAEERKRRKAARDDGNLSLF